MLRLLRMLRTSRICPAQQRTVERLGPAPPDWRRAPGRSLAPGVGRADLAANRTAVVMAANKRIFGQEYEKALELLGALRKELMRRSQSSSDRQRIFTDLVNSPLLEYLGRGHKRKVERLLSRIVGGDWNLSDLGVRL